MSYLEMAAVYDMLMKDAPYQEWAEFARKRMTERGEKGSVVLDLGCGTGTITRLMADYGFRMIGIDNSESMLSIAQNRAMEEGRSIQWMLQDIRHLQGFHQIDAAISFCDVINYITETDEVSQVFCQVNKALKMKGLFMFDVHSMGHIENDMQGSTFAEIYDDVSYVWLCDSGERTGEVFHDLTFFVREGEIYKRFDETHHQRTFEAGVYQELLQKNGFQLTAMYGDFSDQKGLQENNSRIFIVAEKVGELK